MIGKTLDTLLELKALAAETTSTDGTGKALGPTGLVKVMIKVTAVAGTNPTLDLKIQDGPTSTPTTDRLGIPRITATGEYEGYFKSTQSYVRYSSTIGGTGSPSFTYSVHLTA